MTDGQRGREKERERKRDRQTDRQTKYLTGKDAASTKTMTANHGRY